MASLNLEAFAVTSIANSSMSLEKINGVVSGSNSLASGAPTAFGSSDSSRKLQEQERLFNESKQQQQLQQKQLLQHFQQQQPNNNDGFQMKMCQPISTMPSNCGSVGKLISQPDTEKMNPHNNNNQHSQQMMMMMQQHQQQLLASQNQQQMENFQPQQQGQQHQFREQQPVMSSVSMTQQQQMLFSSPTMASPSTHNNNNNNSPLALTSKQQPQQLHASQQQKQYQQFLYQKFLAFQQQQQQMQINASSSMVNVSTSKTTSTVPVPVTNSSATSSIGMIPKQAQFGVSQQQFHQQQQQYLPAALAAATTNAPQSSSSKQKSVETMNPPDNSIKNLHPLLLSPQVQVQQQMPMISAEQITGTAFNQIPQIQNKAFWIGATKNTGNNISMINNNNDAFGVDPSSIKEQQIPPTASHSSTQQPPTVPVPWPLFQPTVCVPYFDMDTYQKVNLDGLPSAMSNGLDLPFNDIPTLRFFFNFGVQHARTVLLKQHLSSNNSAQQQQQQPQNFSGNVPGVIPGRGSINNNSTTMLAVSFNNKSQGQPLSSRIQNTLQHSNVPPPPKAIGQNIAAKTMYPAGAAFSAGTTTQQMSSPNQPLMDSADASASMGAQLAAAQQHQQQEQLSAYFQQQFAAAAMTNGFGHSNGFAFPPGSTIRKRQRAKRTQSKLQQSNQAVNSDLDQQGLCAPKKRQRKTALKNHFLKNNNNNTGDGSDQKQNEQQFDPDKNAPSFPKTNSALFQQKILEKQQQYQNFMQLQQQQNFLMAAHPENNGMGAASASPLTTQKQPPSAPPSSSEMMFGGGGGYNLGGSSNDGYAIDNEEQQRFLQQLTAQQHMATAANATAKITSHDRHGPMKQQQQLNRRPESVTVISSPPALVSQNEALSTSFCLTLLQNQK